MSLYLELATTDYGRAPSLWERIGFLLRWLERPEEFPAVLRMAEELGYEETAFQVSVERMYLDIEHALELPAESQERERALEDATARFSHALELANDHIQFETLCQLVSSSTAPPSWKTQLLSRLETFLSAAGPYPVVGTHTLELLMAPPDSSSGD